MEYIFTFLEGIASFISPCLLPMLPIYVSYFVGEKEDTKKAVFNSIGFVFGFTVVFLLLSIFASVFGIVINRYLSYFKKLFGVIIILLRFKLYGINEI